MGQSVIQVFPVPVSINDNHDSLSLLQSNKKEKGRQSDPYCALDGLKTDLIHFHSFTYFLSFFFHKKVKMLLTSVQVTG